LPAGAPRWRLSAATSTAIPVCVFFVWSHGAVKTFSDLTEREVLAVAIAPEEEDSRIYHAFAEDLA
jgi:hypothetical protein